MLSLLALFACSEKGGVDTAQDSVDLLAIFERQLTGLFDSSAQSQENSTYYDVSLQACSVSIEGIATPALYIEQALSEQLNSPYRQRVYILHQLDEITVSSEIYEIDPPEDYIGSCGENEVRTVSFDSLTLKEGCEVVLEWNGEGFVGETQVNTCKSDMDGASYATSVVETTETMISSWDQGWNSNDQQVWGAVDGPYIFLRK